jgi:hypothetical protein
MGRARKVLGENTLRPWNGISAQKENIAAAFPALATTGGMEARVRQRRKEGDYYE